MVKVTGIVKDILGGSLVDPALKLNTSLDTFYQARQHTIDYPLLRNYLWRVTLPNWTVSGSNYDSERSVFGNAWNMITNAPSMITNYALNSVRNIVGKGDTSFPPDFVPKVVRAKVPIPGMDTVSTTYQGWEYSWPTKVKLGSFTCDLWADEQGYSLGYYMLWHYKMKNRDGTVNYPNAYERDVPIGLYAADGHLCIQLTAYKCFPTALDDINLSDGSGQQIIPGFKMTLKTREIGVNKINEPRNFVEEKLSNIYSSLARKIS